MDNFRKPNPQTSYQQLVQVMPLRLLILLLSFPILATIVGEALFLLLAASDDQIEIVFFPFAEELFKLAIFIRFPRHFVIGIISFGIVELAVVKISSFLISSLTEGDWSWVFFAVPPLLFHVAAAIAYGAVRARERAYAIFILCLVAHVIFNSLTLLDVSHFTWIALTLLTSLIVALAGRAIASRPLP